MADTYKILGQALTGQLALDNTTIKEEIIYEVPANTQASISAIEITNSSNISQSYNLSFVKAEDVESSITSLKRQIAIYNKPIASGQTHELKGGIVLSAGDQIRVYSDSDEIITNVYGVEL